HDTQWLIEVIGDGVVVDLGEPALLGAQGTGEVAEMVGSQGDVRSESFADGLTVVPGVRDGDFLEVLLDTVGDAMQDQGTLGRGDLAPGWRCLVCCVEREFDVCGLAAGHLTEHLTGDGCDVVHVLTIDWWDPLTADEVLVALTEVDDRTFGPWVRINSHVLSFLVELRGTCDDDYVWKAKYATVFPLFLIDQHPTPVSPVRDALSPPQGC